MLLLVLPHGHGRGASTYGVSIAVTGEGATGRQAVDGVIGVFVAAPALRRFHTDERRTCSNVRRSMAWCVIGLALGLGYGLVTLVSLQTPCTSMRRSAYVLKTAIPSGLGLG